MTDITEQARAQQHRELLVAELDHRVKNTLATVIAVAEQTLARAETLDGFRETFLGRTRALARTHEALAASRWSGIDLAGLVQLVVAPFTDGSSPLAVGSANPSLPPALVTPLAIELHELSTNAAKYGAIAQDDGALVIHGAIEDGSLVLRWEEHHVAPPATPPLEGLGLRLVRGLLEHELGGEVSLAIEPERICRLVVPLGDEG